MPTPVILTDTPGEKLFLLGNEAIARGAIEAGVQVVAAYPGTPSTEITETLAAVAGELEMYVEWSVNEKVAFEIALAASVSGLRALATMKQVGVNVAHDPIMTASYIGAKGGFVLAVADDPFAWSSQSEQDSRYIAEQAYIPILEPSTIQEAKDMMVDAFSLSEEFKHLFMFRSVTRISHGRSDVTLGNISREKRKATFEKNRSWLVYTPVEVRINKPLMLDRFEKIKEAVNTLKYNELNLVDGAETGIIASGLSYTYTVEALELLGLDGRVSVLKIGTPHPLPEKLVKQLLGSVKEVLIIEELDPFVETHVKAIASDDNCKVKIYGKALFSRIGELSTRKVAEAIAKLTNSELPIDFSPMDGLAQQTASLLPWRPPVLCPGCPHRASQYAIKLASKAVAKDYGTNVEPIYPGDIGCYTLGYNPPLEAEDITICMGGGFGVANGLAHIIDAPIVAHLGDSTFFHSGIPPMINAVYNQANITMVVLDNTATAMTGFQPNPGTGVLAMGGKGPPILIEDVAKACRVQFVEVIDPFKLKESVKTLERAIRFDGPAVVVSRSPCAIIDQREKQRNGEKTIPFKVDEARCNSKCDACISLIGCPAILRDGDLAVIEGPLCTGCGLCATLCPYGAIKIE